MMRHEQQVEIFEAVMDQTEPNKIQITIEPDHGYIRICVKDNLGEIGDSVEKTLDAALLGMWDFLESFVDELAART